MAAAFDNPDYVSIVIHDYRWRLGLAEGEAKYDDLEGYANGAPHPDPRSYTKKFSGKYSNRIMLSAQD
jgi:hypothetical protein